MEKAEVLHTIRTAGGISEGQLIGLFPEDPTSVLEDHLHDLINSGLIILSGGIYSPVIPMQNSALTDRVLAYRYLQDFKMDDAIDWAIEMLLKGHETPSILILSGLSKPTYFFETENYLLSAFTELQLTIPEKHEAIINYCKHLIEDIAGSKNVKPNLSRLYQLGHPADTNPSIFDFYLLYWAWDGLDYGDTYQHYWPEAGKENIESIVINEAKKWLRDHSVTA